MCRNRNVLFDSSQFNLACTRTTRNVRNSRNGSELTRNPSHEKRTYLNFHGYSEKTYFVFNIQQLLFNLP